MNIRQQILTIITESFTAWDSTDSQACSAGCSACCTQNVTMTALEGERILDFFIEQNSEDKLSAIINSLDQVHPKPEQTDNEFATACFNGIDHEEPEQLTETVCPFLDNNLCTIYPVRPFSCRCFSSTRQCSPSQPAVMENRRISTSTVIKQLIEHLGQGEYWGNMMDVLPAMLDISAYSAMARQLNNNSTIFTARERVRTATPLPGFLLAPEDMETVTPLLEKIFQQEIEGKSVEDILNGR